LSFILSIVKTQNQHDKQKWPGAAMVHHLLYERRGLKIGGTLK
jgi:hypothetical protein